MSARLLLVDDEPDVLAPVRWALEREGYLVDTAEDGERGLELARRRRFDAILLDLMLPGRNGLDVCRTLRAESDVPVILLTARDAEVDRVIGLELGADDYVTKPFSIAELLSRVRAILRRRELDGSPTRATREASGITVDLEQHSVSVDGTAVDLTPSEFRLLLLFIDHPDEVFSRTQLMEHLWQSEYFGDPRACDTHIANLRAKIERSRSHPERLVTVRGVGYKLAVTRS